MAIIHLTARLRPKLDLRIDREHAPWLWARLREAFPKALAVVFMGNHPHLVVDVDDPIRARTTFAKVLAAFARRLRLGRGTWQPMPPLDLLVDPDRIAFVVRYVWLNPARRRWIRDPLRWFWSSYRDLFGATADPWTTFERLQPYLPPRLKTLSALHDFVSADRFTHVEGTTMPAPPDDARARGRPLCDLLAAAAAATRATMTGHRRPGPMRDLFVWLAHRQGWTTARTLGEVCGVTADAIRKILRGPPPAGLDAARQCLADDRLLFSIGAPGAPEQEGTRIFGPASRGTGVDPRGSIAPAR